MSTLLESFFVDYFYIFAGHKFFLRRQAYFSMATVAEKIVNHYHQAMDAGGIYFICCHENLKKIGWRDQPLAYDE